MKKITAEPFATDAAFIKDAEHIRFAANAAGIGLWEVNLATSTLLWDNRCRELFGITDGNVIPYAEAIQYIHPDDVEDVNRKVQAAVRGENGGLYDATYRTIGADDGRLRWVNFNGTAYFDSSGNITRFGGIAQDVTSRLQSRQDLKESEARFRSLVAQAPVATCLFTGREMKIEIANSKMLALWGKGDAVIGMPLAEALPELKGQPFLNILDEAFTTGKAYSDTSARCDLVVDGVLTPFYFDFTYKPLLNEAGEVYGIMDMATDVTQQALARQQLAESEERFRSIVKKAPVAMFIFRGADMVIDIANEKALELINRTEAVLGKPLLEAVPELRGTSAYETFQEVFHTGIAQYGQEVLVPLKKDGLLEERWFNFTYTPLYENGQVVGVMDVASDVTGQVLARQRLAESEERFRLITEIVPNLVWMLQPDGSFKYINQTGLDYLGTTYEQIAAQGWEPYIHSDDLERVKRTVNDAVQAGQPYTCEHRLRTKNGDYRWVFSQAVPAYSTGGSINSYIGSGVDIHDRLLAKEKLEASEAELQERVKERTQELSEANEALQSINKELQRSNANLEEFAHAASHDLKEPIRKITFFTQYLKAQLEPHLDEAGMRSFSRIENAAQRMGALIDDLLLYSHVSQRPHQTEAVDLNAKAHRVLEDLELDIEEKRATINIGQLPTVMGYRRQLQQLLQNLVSNALKYSREDVPPVININAGTATEGGRQYNVITVSDNGIGFDQQYADKIFQMFARLHGKSEYSGTGVGLSIVKKVAENHDGFVQVKSTPGEGSAFSVWLPTD